MSNYTQEVKATTKKELDKILEWHDKRFPKSSKEDREKFIDVVKGYDD